MKSKENSHGECYFLFRAIPTDDLISNRIGNCSGMDYAEEYVPGLCRGMKTTAFIHKVFNNEKLDIAFSEFHEKTKTKGYVTISIDPIDYMLMSINNSGWQSCHSLCKGKSGVHLGEYSAGVFSYMCDTSSLIAFRHTKNEPEDIVINGTKIKALNKSWRQMVFVNLEDKFFVCSREYPNKNELVSQYVREEVEALISQRYGIPNSWKVSSERNVNDFVKDTPKILDESNSTLHYNDMKQGYDGRIVYQTRLDDYSGSKVTVGSFPTCPICGRMRLTKSSRPFCNMCNDEDVLNARKPKPEPREVTIHAGPGYFSFV